MIDTWYRYPTEGKAARPSKHPFHKLDNIVMTPHLSGWTDGTQERRWNVMIDNIERLMGGRELRNVVKPATA
jgi:phosphoglycerate dehydrogenase-like enzyme